MGSLTGNFCGKLRNERFFVANVKKTRKNRVNRDKTSRNRGDFLYVAFILVDEVRQESTTIAPSGGVICFVRPAEDSHLGTRRIDRPMAKKAAPKAAPAPPKSAAPEKAVRAKAATKAEIYSQIAEKTSLAKKDVAVVFDALGELINKELGKKGPGLFIIPGLLKLKVVRKPATKAKQGINPFTKEPLTIKAKPARNVIKALPLKALKEIV